MTSSSPKFVIPQSLKDRLVEGKVVLFVGAGLSRNANAPDWKMLLKGLVEQCDSEGISITYRSEVEALIDGSPNEMMIAADHIRDAMQEKMNEHIETCFSRLVPQQAHFLIARLKFRGVVTTNYDGLLEGARTESGNEMILPVDTHKLSRLNDYPQWLLKIHGTYKEPNRVVLSSNDYENLPKDATETLSRIFQEHTILFIGYGLGDPDILGLLSRIRRVFQGMNPRHYALVESSTMGDILEKYMLNTFKIQAIKYTKSSPNHPEVTEFLGQLLEHQSAALRDEMEKLLVLIIARRILDDGTSEPVILVTDNNPQWKTARSNSHEGRQERYAYLLPSLSNPSILADKQNEAIASFLGVSNNDIIIKVDPKVFESIKFNPSTHKETHYRFHFAHVQFRAGVFSPQETVQLMGRTYTWHSIMSLRGHAATEELNGDVLVEISKRYGGNLEALLPSLPVPIYRFSDPYSVRSELYGSLPWVKDKALFDQIFADIDLNALKGVLEFGCGPALLGRYLADNSRLAYVGLDSSYEMVRVAGQRLDDAPNSRILRMNIACESSEQKYDGWLFVVKNVLHLLDDPHQMLSTLKDRFGNPTQLVVVETVNPSTASLAWIQSLFSKLGVTYKRQWFIRGQMAHILRLAGWTIVREQKNEQYIEIDSWLRSFQIGSEHMMMVKQYVETAPPNVIREMKINQDNGESLRMLRLQAIYHAHAG